MNYETNSYKTTLNKKKNYLNKKMLSNVKPYLNQNYAEIKKHHLAQHTLFNDDQFPANDQSISLLPTNSKHFRVYWKRPHELVTDPKFIVNGIDPNDLSQGQTGNCWFISAASTLASIDKLARHVIPVKQTFNRGEYAGVFYFRYRVRKVFFFL